MTDLLPVLSDDHSRARRTNPQHELGGFVVDDGRLIISDPCYDHDDAWVTLTDVTNGEWTAYTERVISHGARIAALEVRAAGVDRDACEWSVHHEDAGVDSGQCGIWRSDAQLGQGEWTDGHQASFYHRSCEATRYPPGPDPFDEGQSRGSVMPEGAVSSSGHGDGSYPILVARRSGRVVGVRVEFIDPTKTAVTEQAAREIYATAMTRYRERMRG